MFFLQLTSNFLCQVLLGIIEPLSEKKDHVQKFRNYKQNVSDNFQRPKNAGRKPNYAKRIRTSPDPDIVMSRLEEVSASRYNSSSRPVVIAESSRAVKQ